MNKITLYHGSSYDFDTVDLHQSRPYKDFGQGFYASADIGHAISIAERNVQMRKSKLRQAGIEYEFIKTWLYHYLFDADKSEGLAIKEFTEADREWGQFITLNRRSN